MRAFLGWVAGIVVMMCGLVVLAYLAIYACQAMWVTRYADAVFVVFAVGFVALLVCLALEDE